jgi:hypothetical protein
MVTGKLNEETAMTHTMQHIHFAHVGLEQMLKVLSECQVAVQWESDYYPKEWGGNLFRRLFIFLIP